LLKAETSGLGLARAGPLATLSRVGPEILREIGPFAPRTRLARASLKATPDKEGFMTLRGLTWTGVLLAGTALGCGGGSPAQLNGQGDGGGSSDGGKLPDGGMGNDAAKEGGQPGEGGEGGPISVLPGPSHGSPIVLSPDDSIALVVNRDVGSVTVLQMSYAGQTPAAVVLAEIALGSDSEPWQVAISPDGTRGYVILRKSQQLAVIEGLNTKPTLGAKVAVGSEPTGLALTPTGAEVWVTNWVDGTVSVVDSASMKVKKTIDLNAPLVATTFLGTITARPALAHPRSIAITNNLDTSDSDESAYVTEYYAQVETPEAADGSNADTHKVGIVYKIGVASSAVTTVQLGPIADMGFKDQNNGTAGCYPNQIQSIAVNGTYAYVLSVCASPKGPTGPLVTTTACTTATDCASLNLVEPLCAQQSATATGSVCVDAASVKTTTAPVVSVLDISGATPTEVATATASLNAQFDALYTAAGTPDDSTRRYPLFADDIAFVPGSSVGYVTANGGDAVFRIQYDTTSGAIAQVGASTNQFINLNPTGIAASLAGENPIGIAISNTGKSIAVVANDVTRNASILDFKAQSIAGFPTAPSVVATTALPTAGTPQAALLAGKRFFDTGVGIWSLKGQGWGACQSCHGDGLTDNVTWYFARGPRQSTSLDGTFNSTDPTDQRILNWTAINDELADFELNVRGVSGGIGGIMTVSTTPPVTADRMDISGNGNAALNGSAAQAADPSNPLALPAPSINSDWASITAFVQNIRSPRGVSTLDPKAVAAGLSEFTSDGQCVGCHAGGKWTMSKVFYTPSPATNTALKTTAWPALNGFPAALLPATTPADQVMRFGSTNPSLFDQILCTLRPVGTFGVAETGAGIAELRIDMATAAQGNGDASGNGKGYNVPSLLNVVTGAPYLHGGQARTLEALFSTTFAEHHQSLAPNFLTETDPTTLATNIDNLVSFLLSIDESTSPVTLPGVGPQGGDFCTAP
jgi:YVTN family beta-propeller protein